MEFKDLNLQKIKEHESNFLKSYEWWQKLVDQKAKTLERLEASEDSNILEQEQLRRDLEILNNKGIAEQKIINSFEIAKRKYYLNSLISGALSIKNDS